MLDRLQAPASVTRWTARPTSARPQAAPTPTIADAAGRGPGLRGTGRDRRYDRRHGARRLGLALLDRRRPRRRGDPAWSLALRSAVPRTRSSDRSTRARQASGSRVTSRPRRLGAGRAGRAAVGGAGARSPSRTTTPPCAPDFDGAPRAEAEELVEAETGLRSLAGPARARVIDRAALGPGQRRLLPAPARARCSSSSTSASTPAAALGPVGRHPPVSARGGVLLGWMSGRVLGQYDLLVVDDEDPDRAGPRVLRGPQRARPGEEASPSRPGSSGCGWPCTRSPTGPSSPGCRGCGQHFLGLVSEMLDAGRPRPAAPAGRPAAAPLARPAGASARSTTAASAAWSRHPRAAGRCSGRSAG